MTVHKSIIFIVLVLSLFTISLSFSPYVRAQSESTPYELAYKSYLDQLSKYQKDHQEYVLRKSQFESFGTLQSQQDLQVALVKMLQERDETVLTYLKALRERVTENPGIDSTNKDLLFARIDTEITWFTDHKSNIPTAGSLKDLSDDSNLAKKEYENAHPVFYESIASVSNGKFTDLEKRLNDRFIELKELIRTIKSEQREEYVFSSTKLARLDRWVFDAVSTQERALKKQTEAEDLILTFSTKNKAIKNLSSAYSQVLTLLGEAQQYLRETGNYMQEIIGEIKTQEE